MIIQIDHIALTSSQFVAHKKFFTEMGYRLKFEHSGIPNLNIKKAFMRRESLTQDLALLQSADNVPIELVNHEYEHAGDPAYMPIFGGVPEERITQMVPNEPAPGFKRLRLRDLATPVSIASRASGKKFSFNSCISYTADPQESVDFWQCFGFQLAAKIREDHTVLNFVSPFKKEFSLHLMRTLPSPRVSFLDDIGFTCIAFVSSSAKNQKGELEDAGHAVTDIETVAIDGKKLEVFFARSKQGELAEVISLA